MNPVFFRTPGEMCAYFARHHETAAEIHVGFHKKGSGEPGVTWPEAVDEALCVGWIDGVRRGAGDHAYVIRFTPRRKGSIWSAVNIRKADALIAAGRMQPAGLAALAARREERSRIYSYEQPSTELAEPYLGLLRGNAAAWTFFQSQPPSYRKIMSHWITGAKQGETRLRRLAKLADASAQGRRVA